MHSLFYYLFILILLLNCIQYEYFKVILTFNIKVVREIIKKKHNVYFLQNKISD